MPGVKEAADNLTPEQRKKTMSRIRSRDTKPEMLVRSYLHGKGYRYRLHRRDLPGCPDLVFAQYRVVVFVHGCFWHQHPGCPRAVMPKTRQEYWRPKLQRNVQRWNENMKKLERLGWKVLVVWECQLESSLEDICEALIDELKLS